MRVFLAFELPPDILAYLAALIEKMTGIVKDVRWVRGGGIHVTVKFFGEMEEEKVRAMEPLLAPLGDQFAPFEASLDCIDAFPTKRRARVIIVRLGEGIDVIREVFSVAEEKLSRMGIGKEPREFTPHLTLGRKRTAAPFPGDPPLIEKKRFELKNLVLFKSTLMPAGAAYAPVWKITLGGTR
jgi:RNA 2',3'-cyclic 3'-phosphodiesterase